MAIVTQAKIIATVCKAYGQTEAELLGPLEGSHRNISEARFVAAYFMRKLRHDSWQQIAEALKRRAHSTVVYNVKMMEKWLRELPEFRAQVEELEKGLAT